MKDTPVLVGVDGSADSRDAVAYGAWEARQRHLPLRLVHGLVPAPTFGIAPTVPAVTEALFTDARALVAEAAAGVRRTDSDLPVGTAVIAGGPAGVLVEEAAHAALVVVGSRGLGGYAGLLAGSVSIQVATHAPVPVVVLRHSAPPAGPPAVPGTGPVVVGVDGSAGSMTALEFGLDEAAARGTGLIAVYAWAVPPRGNLGPITPSHYDEREARDEADRLLAEALAGWDDKYPDVPVERRVVHSFNPLLTLLEESTSASLIVVGPRGHGGFVSLLLGSVADGLLRHAHRPVAIVHASRSALDRAR
jgi:nucleotide-binding universal stress UspA family protein